MAKINDLLIQKDNETIEMFDKRISELPYQHIGYAFFECLNYNQEKHIFSLFIVWNDKINSLLEDQLPPTGFQIRCSRQMAECLLFENVGVPIFAKLTSIDGLIHANNLIIRYFDRNYIVSYTGINAVMPKEVWFRNTPEIDENKYNSILNSSYNYESSFNSNYKNVKEILNKNSGSFFKGSFNLESLNLGSFNLESLYLGSFNIKSFINSSFYLKYLLKENNIGSFNIGSFNIGSFNIGSFNAGAYNLNSFKLTSFNFGSFNWKLYNTSYFSKEFMLSTSFSSGSFYLESINLTSFRNSLFNNGSFKRIKTVLSSSFNVLSDENFNQQLNGQFPFEELLKEIFGIGFMGYGLNLI